MLFSWQARKTDNGTFFYTGAFAILFAIYSLSITDTIHLFIQNSQFIYLLDFLLLALSPLPLLMLVFRVCIPKFRPIILVDIIILTLNFCLQTALYFFTELELRDTVQVTHIILGFQLGVLLFIFLQTVYLVRSYLKSDLYRKVAYTDALTGLQNRTAFEARVSQLSKTVSHYDSVWCVCADVNCLKSVNDTLGHSAGDELIRGAAMVLHEARNSTCGSGTTAL